MPLFTIKDLFHLLLMGINAAINDLNVLPRRCAICTSVMLRRQNCEEESHQNIGYDMMNFTNSF